MGDARRRAVARSKADALRLVAVTLTGGGRDLAPSLASARFADAHMIVPTSDAARDEVETFFGLTGTNGFAQPNERRIKIRPWQWTGIFSDALNSALAIGALEGADWVMLLDDDETVVCQDTTKLRDCLANAPAHIKSLLVTQDGSSSRERLWRTPIDGRFVGRTHERFDDTPGSSALLPSWLVTWHEAQKSAAELASKHERDVVLLRAEIVDNPNEHRWPFYLGSTLAFLGRHEEALDAMQLAASLAPPGEAAGCTYVRIAESLLRLKRYEECLVACAKGLTQHAGIAELPWLASAACLSLERPDQAAMWALLATVHGYDGPGRGVAEQRTGFRIPKALREGPAEVLSFAMQAMGNSPIAIAIRTGLEACR